jgi:hypothetical protein
MDSAERTVQERLAFFIERAPAPRGDEPYGRLPLLRDRRGELMLAGWRSGERCAPHDHGDAHGIVIVLAGRFTETRYEKRAQGLVPAGQVTLATGSTVPVEAGLIHDMRCDAAGATLHVYLPAIAQMRVYDLAQRSTWVVDDNAGAWIPRDDQYVIATEAWSDEPA